MSFAIQFFHKKIIKHFYKNILFAITKYTNYTQLIQLLGFQHTKYLVIRPYSIIIVIKYYSSIHFKNSKIKLNCIEGNKSQNQYNIIFYFKKKNLWVTLTNLKFLTTVFLSPGQMIKNLNLIPYTKTMKYYLRRKKKKLLFKTKSGRRRMSTYILMIIYFRKICFLLGIQNINLFFYNISIFYKTILFMFFKKQHFSFLNKSYICYKLFIKSYFLKNILPYIFIKKKKATFFKRRRRFKNNKILYVY